VSETNNGYEIKKFTSPKDFQNTYPTSSTYIIGSEPYATNRKTWLDFRVSNGTFPNLWQNNEILRGNLLSIDTYNNSNTILKKNQNEYIYLSFDKIASYDNLFYPDGFTFYDNPFYLRMFSTIKSERNYLSRTIKTNYLSNGNYVVQSNYVFDTDKTKPFIKEKSIVTSDNKILKEKYYYPYDNEVSMVSGVTDLLAKNIITVPIKTKSFSDSNLLSTQLTKYKNWGNNIILPKNVQDAKSVDPLEVRVVYRNYDDKGNPIEISQENGVNICYIWGYNKTQPIAKIENATYAQMQSQVSNLQTLSNADNDRTIGDLGKEGALRTALNNLRAALPVAIVTTYTYDPLIGVTSITDSRGQTAYYEYDDFNRLEFIKNAQGEILTKNEYNYKRQ